MDKVLLLKRAVCSSALLSLVACSSNDDSNASAVSSAIESTASSADVSSSTVSSIVENSSSTTVAISSIAESSSSVEASSSVAESSSSVAESSSSSAAATTNLLSDPSFESGTLNGDYWQTNGATISTDAEFFTDGASGVDIGTNYVEMTLPADTLSNGSLYFVSVDARAFVTRNEKGDVKSAWKNWNVELYADDDKDKPVESRTFNQLALAGLFDSGQWYERAVAFPAPSSIIGINAKLRINGVIDGAMDNVQMKKIDTFIKNYDFEDGNVSDFVASGNSPITANTAQPILGSTSLGFTLDEANGYIELPLEQGVVQPGKRYVITMGFGTATVKVEGAPFLVHFIDTATGETIGKDTYNYAYYAGEGAQLSAAFVIDVDEDQSSNADWAASTNMALRMNDIWGNVTGTELLIDNLTLSEIKD